jgi:hypothetical protein
LSHKYKGTNASFTSGNGSGRLDINDLAPLVILSDTLLFLFMFDIFIYLPLVSF